MSSVFILVHPDFFEECLTAHDFEFLRWIPVLSYNSFSDRTQEIPTQIRVKLSGSLYVRGPIGYFLTISDPNYSDFLYLH